MKPARSKRATISVTVRLRSGTIVAAKLVIGADGRRSLCRAAAGIETDGSSYPQIALTFNLSHARPHDDISTEFHTETGPFTLVPLPGQRSSLVCVVDDEDAERISALDDAALATKSSSARIRSSARSASSRAAARFRSPSRPRGGSRRTASR